MLPKLTDLNAREFGMLVPLVVLVFWIGLYPKPLLDVMHASVERVVAMQPVSIAVQHDGGSPSKVFIMSEISPPALNVLAAEVAP